MWGSEAAGKIRADISVSEQLREESQMQSRHLIRSAGWAGAAWTEQLILYKQDLAKLLTFTKAP